MQYIDRTSDPENGRLAMSNGRPIARFVHGYNKIKQFGKNKSLIIKTLKPEMTIHSKSRFLRDKKNSHF